MKKIFNYVPHWMVSGLRGRKCTKCNTVITKKNITAVGVRDIRGRQSIFAEHLCPSCKYREMTSFDHKKATIEELCYILLEGVKFQRATERAKQIESKNNANSKISDKEVKSFLDFMNSNESHEEFMKFIKADKFGGSNEQHENEG